MTNTVKAQTFADCHTSFTKPFFLVLRSLCRTMLPLNMHLTILREEYELHQQVTFALLQYVFTSRIVLILRTSGNVLLEKKMKLTGL